MKYKTEIKGVLFRYADALLLKNKEGEKEIKGFLYRKTTRQEGYLWQNGVRDKDLEFSLVADDTGIVAVAEIATDCRCRENPNWEILFQKL